MNLRAAVAVATACVATSVAFTPAGAAHDSRARATCFGRTPSITASTGQVVNGTSRGDVVIGGSTVYANDGNDLVCDATTVYGGDGNDRVQLSDGGTAFGQAGNDEFVALSSSVSSPTGATLNGGAGDDVFWGSPGGDTIYGSSGNDSIRASGGNDSVDLGSGNDLAYGDPGDDHILGGVGHDRVDGGTGRDTVDGQGGRNRCAAVEFRYSCRKVTSVRRSDAFDRLLADLAEDGIRLE